LKPSADPPFFVRSAGDVDGSPPPVLLLHGWFASAGLNWIRTFGPLARRHFVIAPDLPGHARSAPHGASPNFDIDATADALAALLTRVSPDRPAIVVGYSLGGMVAQALWRRHPEQVAGLVLGATSAAPIPVSRGRSPFVGLLGVAHHSSRLVDLATRFPRQITATAQRQLAQLIPGLPASHWALREFAQHDWPTVLDAGRAIAQFDTRDWIAEIDVPTSVIMTKRDSLIPVAQQLAMIESLRAPHVETFDSGHFACIRADFAESVLACCRAIERDLS
jgi:pimeloyl-ACP methyl ester carboxylesterase